MSGIYGSFLVEGNISHGKYYDKFCQRVDNFYTIAKFIKSQMKDKSCYQSIHIDFSNIALAVGKYLNDVIRLKEMHNIEVLHRSKIAAYTIKWLRVNPVFSCSLTEEQFKALSDDEKSVCMNLNYILYSSIIDYCIEENDNQQINHPHFNKAKLDIEYQIKFDCFEEHAVASLLSFFA